MKDDLSPTMAEALRRCVAAGGLKYVRGGFWVEATRDPAPFLRLGHSPQTARSEALPWHTTTHTVKALLKRGVVFEPTEARGEYLALVRATNKGAT